jgi:VWFA-related protein
MSRRQTTTFLVAAATLLVLASVAAQSTDQPQGSGQPAVTFRQDINYVEVDAIVTDAQGRFVRDLTLADFEVREDGKVQEVSTFGLVDIPATRPDQPLFSPTVIPSDVRTNRDRFDGRVYVLVLDDLHTNALRSALVKRAATRFIDRYVAGNDLVAVIHTSGRTDAAQEFTENKALLRAAVDKFMGRKTRAATLERIDSYFNQANRLNRAAGERPDDPSDFERGYNARSAMSSLKNLSDYLAGVRGRRKAVVLLSEGIDYDIYDVFNSRYASSVLDDVRDAIGAATRGNVAFYAIDPRGLSTLGDDSIEIAGLPDDPTLNLGPSSLQSELRLAQDSLRVLAEETGGLAVVNTNDFERAFDRIVEDNSSYYLLGYYPANTRRDGRPRKLEVRVSRPGVVVRARKGYVAPRGRPPAQETNASPAAAALREAMSSPLQVSGLPLTVHAAPFKGVAPNASVAIALRIDGQALGFTQRDGLFRNELTVAVQALDSAGKVFPGERSTLKLDLRPPTHDAVRAVGFGLHGRLNVPPGRYQLRVAVHEAGGRTGSVFYDLVVPDFAAEGLAMSGVLVTSTASSAMPTARPDEQFRDLLPAPATAVREFDGRDTLATFVEVYDNTKANDARVDITTQLLADDGRSVFQTAEVRAKSELQGSRGGYGVATRIPLQELPAGLYVLKVEAASRLGGVAPASQQVPFRIRRAAGAGSPTAQGGPPAHRPASEVAATPPAPEATAAPAAPEAPPTAPVASAPVSPAASEAPVTPPASAVRVVNVVRGTHAAVSEPRQTVARTAAEFEALWKSLGLSQAMPTVNFETTMVAAVFIGERPTSGYQVEVSGAMRAGDALHIQYVERVPAAGTMSAQVLTSPFHVVGVPRHDGPVEFVKVTP